MTNFMLRPPGPFERELAALIIDVFGPRRDVYAWRVDDADTAERLTAWERERGGGRVWRIGDWRPAGSRAHRRPVTPEDVALHIVGARTLGFYPMHADGTCRSVSADFDNHRGAAAIARDPAEDYEALTARFAREEVPWLGHRSRGGRGYWAHLLVPDGTPAREARAVLHGLLRAAGVRPVAEGGTFDGIFPKQDVPSPTGPGNLYCLPLSRRWLANEPPGGHFVGVDPRDFDAQVFHLWKARRVSRARWDELVARYARPSSPPALAARRPPPVRALVDRARERAAARTPPGVWEIALRRAKRVGRALGEGRYALLCVHDDRHSNPDHSVENARGSCVLFPPSERHPEGRPWCAHAHCASLRTDDWIAALGRDAWDDACLAARGMRRAGPWVLSGSGISTWFRGLDGTVTPSRRDVLCEVPLWVVEEVRTARRTVRVVDAVVRGKVRRVRVDVRRFASLAWLRRLGVDPDTIPPWQRPRLVEAIERLSEPVPLRGDDVVQPASPERADDLLRLLDVVLHAAGTPAENESAPVRRVNRR